MTEQDPGGGEAGPGRRAGRPRRRTARHERSARPARRARPADRRSPTRQAPADGAIADANGGGTRAERREARRRELLDAAIAAVRREGPDVSMEAMAAEAGVTKPILYRHFGDRSGLVAAIAVEFAHRLDEAVLSRLAIDADPEELLRTTVDAYLRFVEEETQVYRFLVRRVVTAEPGGAETLTAFIDEVARRIALVIGEQLRGRGLDSGMAEPWAHALVGAVHQAGDRWLEQRTLTRERLVDFLMRLLWSGLGAYAADADADASAGEGAIPPG